MKLLVEIRTFWISLFLCLPAAAAVAQERVEPRVVEADRFDIGLLGGRVIDGTGGVPYVTDVGIRDGKIVHIGRIERGAAKREIDAKGLVVAPGFIDMMGQTATPMLEKPESALNLLTQGITTINAGEGVSAAPLAAGSERTAGWRTMGEYFQLLDLAGMPVNVVQTVGHTQVRRIVLGEVDRRPNDDELRRMQDLVREGMESGAIGVSTALIYPPAVYATTQEIAALASVAGRYGGRYYTHMRNEGDRLLEAIDEALDIGRTAGAGVHIFHLKTAGRHNWPKMEQAVARIKAAQAAGQRVSADIYPYINNGLGIESFIHPRHFAAGQRALVARLDDAKLRAEIRREIETTDGWENWYRHIGRDWSKVVIGQTADSRYAPLAGRSLAEIAKTRGEEPWDTFFNLVKAGAFALPESMTDENKVRLLREDFISVCTDVGPAGGSQIASHPRAYGAFPRLLSRYVRDLKAVSLPKAIALSSATAAKAVMVNDRGRIAVGLAADVIAFDAEKIVDRATFREPAKLATGMRYVIVNGRLVLDDGKYNGARPGRVLRGPGYRREAAPQAVSSGADVEQLAGIDRAMRDFVRRHHVPGVALAVTDGSRLVMARGYGYADLASGERITPRSLFRIASISKPITAVAILRLVDQKRLRLDDKVLDVLKLAPRRDDAKDSGSKPGKFDERQREITIRHLLEHRGGWDRDKSFDAMFRSVDFAKALGKEPPAGPNEVIQNMLRQPLDFGPGERYAYSNYGYCLLGRVIEQVSGKPYEEFVRSEVLLPLGMKSTRLGKTRLADRQPGEVRYYSPQKGGSVFAADIGQSVPSPYGAWYLEAMDSHGAWLSSAEDLARFAAACHDPVKAKLLSAESAAAMVARPPGLAGHDARGKPSDRFYSLGWVNTTVAGRIFRGHDGSLPGTATHVILRPDGRAFVVLFNARNDADTRHFGQAIDGLLHRAADQVRDWPAHDLFQR